MRRPNDSWRPVVIFVASVNLVVAYILLLAVFKSFVAPVEGLLIGGKPVSTTQQRIYGMILSIAVIAAAIFGTTGYLLVLAALRISPVSYVGPIREVSVVIGTWIGIEFLGEKGGMLRIVASIIVVFGIGLITIFG